MVTHNSSNNFGESNSQTVAKVNNMISDQQLMSNTISLDQQPNVYRQTIPNHQQQYDANYANYQQYSNAISNYSNNVTISPGWQPMSNNNVTTSSDQQPNVSSPNSPNHNQQYQQHNVASPNHQYDANYQQSSDNNNQDSNNTNHNNNQPSSSNNDSSSQFFSPQSSIFLNITINSPQTNFIIIPNSDIRQILAFLNNPSSGFQR
ncbi:unnamed protein product [Rhizophagus irregularis]|uniref:Uncharacterized protein n=1 Tax=Rhizophagus irregularis TaxID=588596 RepID=A0A2I1H6C3_9GLOM|nr:hypothetical protein RhiirA4_473216 [Rhizophagus irregularis]CAB4426684.1 unnamed protein product [Rhizophagus irregularis]